MIELKNIRYDHDGYILADHVDNSRSLRLDSGDPLYTRIIDGEFGTIAAYEPPPPPPLEELLARAKADTVRRINSAYEAELSVILSDYPDAEQMSWSKQEAEARAFTADESAATPLLDAIADARGVDKAELAARVIAKADAWAQMSGAATGKRQALEARIQAATTVAEVEAVAW